MRKTEKANPEEEPAAEESPPPGAGATGEGASGLADPPPCPPRRASVISAILRRRAEEPSIAAGNVIARGAMGARDAGVELAAAWIDGEGPVWPDVRDGAETVVGAGAAIG